MPMRLAALFVLLLGGFTTAPNAHAQDQPNPPGAQPNQPPDGDAKDDAPKDGDAKEGDANRLLREQSIYIPYKQLRDVFEKQGRGVFVPYEKFQELRTQAREKQQKDAESRPPVGALITAIESKATIAADVVNVAATVTIEVLTQGWNEVPLRLSDAAIQEAKLGDEAARVVFRENKGYVLLVEKKEETPRQIELSLNYSKAFTKSPGQNKVSFAAPQAPVNRWQITIPEPGVKVDVHPLLAATEPPADPDNDDPPQETVVLAFVGTTPTVRIEWTPKAEGAAGLSALTTVQAEHQVIVDEGVLRTKTQFDYTISRAELSELLLEAPSSQKVVSVFDSNVRKWDVKDDDPDDGVQQIAVQLFEPAADHQRLTIELESFRDEADAGELAVPVVRAVGAGRQQGVVVARVVPGLRAEVGRRTGLLQVDAAELPDALRQQSWEFAWRYSALPFDLALNVEKIEPRIRSDVLVEAWLEPEKLTVTMFTVFQIDRAGVFQLHADTPPGYDVRRVEGRPVAGGAAVEVDAHHVDDDGRMVVNLTRKAMGKVGLVVELEKQLDDENLREPTGEASILPIGIPRVAADSVERSDGRLVVYSPESLQLTPNQQTGVRRVSFEDALDGIGSVRDGRFPVARPVLTYRFARGPVEVAVDAERRKPHITVRQMLRTHVESGVVKYEAAFVYGILYSGVKSLRIDIPAALNTPDTRFEPESLVRTMIEPAPADQPAGYVSWNFTADADFTQATTIKLLWQTELKDLDVGKSKTIQVPVLKPMEVDRAWGQIVLAKAENLDVNPADEMTGLRGIDPRTDVQSGVEAADAARAFEFHEDWSLAVTATQYKLEEVKRTSIEHAVVRMVVTRDDEVSVQALFRIRSARQRLEFTLPGEVQLDPVPLRINGGRVDLEVGDGGIYHIPLNNQADDEAMLVELRYTFQGDHSRLELPQFPSEPAVQKVDLCVYLPEEMALLGSRGPWTDEQPGRWYSGFGRIYRQDQRDILLIQELNDRSAINTAAFHTDGHKLYVYSTLRPPPDGALRLVAMPEWGLNCLVFLGVAGIGVGLLTRPAGYRFAAIAALAVALIFLGIFFPTLSSRVIGLTLIASVCAVLFVWTGVALFTWSAHRVEAMRARAAERAAAGETTAATAGSTATADDGNETDEPVATAPDAGHDADPDGPSADTSDSKEKSSGASGAEKGGDSDA